MYYFLYGLFYLLSLLPFSVLYKISDGLYLLTFYLVKYRKDVVLNNLRIAFPEKTHKERVAIAKEFYHNLLDTFVEVIKLISLSDKSFLKRCSGDMEVVKQLAAKGKNIQLQPCHQFNVEYYNLLYSKELPALKFAFVYMPFTNEALEKIFNKIRTRYGSVLVAATRFKEDKEKFINNQYAITLGADQNPSFIQPAYWMNFFSAPAAFLSAPAKSAIKGELAIVFVNFIRQKRGHYRFENTVLTENASSLTPEEITTRYKEFVEQSIRKQPANYLWTHKRWKYTPTPDLQHVWTHIN
jgi:Kdo2-lipid IVA lauroyltransferase/acyltransferase